MCMQALDPEINPFEENRRLAFNDHYQEVLEDMMEASEKICKKIVEDESFGDISRIRMYKKFMNALAHNRL